jgi:hypothetical protein
MVSLTAITKEKLLGANFYSEVFANESVVWWFKDNPYTTFGIGEDGEGGWQLYLGSKSLTEWKEVVDLYFLLTGEKLEL